MITPIHISIEAQTIMAMSFRADFYWSEKLIMKHYNLATFNEIQSCLLKHN